MRLLLLTSPKWSQISNLSALPARSPASAPVAPVAPDTKEPSRKLPSRLFLVRHGESTWNFERRVQGQHDPPLSKRGRQQARELAARLGGHPHDGFSSSAPRRAWETAEPLAESLGHEPTPLPGPREIAL